VSKLVWETRCPKATGMKKPPMAASVSIRPVAVPTYWCSTSQTRTGTASQAAKPKMRKNPIHRLPGRQCGDPNRMICVPRRANPVAEPAAEPVRT